ncbi:hypothetical protein BBL07_06485 [Agrobacterium vitis]|nr:hypothetical protein BBL07_06485 [Agrobacterium vitis]
MGKGQLVATFLEKADSNNHTDCLWKHVGMRLDLTANECPYILRGSLLNPIMAAMETAIPAGISAEKTHKCLPL